MRGVDHYLGRVEDDSFLGIIMPQISLLVALNKKRGLGGEDWDEHHHNEEESSARLQCVAVDLE